MNKKHTSSLEQIKTHLNALKQMLEQHADGGLPVEKIETEALGLYEQCVIQRYLENQTDENEVREVKSEPDQTAAEVQGDAVLPEESKPVETEEIAPDAESVTEDSAEEELTSEVNEEKEEAQTDKSEELKETGREVFESFQSSGGMDDGVSYSPIDDLKKAIGLNDRFMFANELFSGHGEEYARAIEEFNHLESMEDAERLIEAKFADKYKWNEEDEAVRLFKTFLYRRYLSKS